MSRFLGFGKPGGAGYPAAEPQERKRDRFLGFLKPHPRTSSPNPTSSALQQTPSPDPSVAVLQPAPSPSPPSSVLQQVPPPNPPTAVLQQPPSNNISSSASRQGLSPTPSGSVLQQPAPPVPTTGGGNDLWTEAYHKLPNELKQQLSKNAPADKLQTLQNMLQVAIQAKEANKAKRLMLKWGDKEIDVQETADRLVGWITKFREVGDIAVQYDPVHAALPWAGVRFILLLAVGEQEKFAAAIVGMERVAVLIGRCAIYEQLYLTGDVPKNAEEATENLRRGLLTLYTAILQALCRLLRVFKGKWIDKLKTPESALAEIGAIDEPESALNSVVSAVGDCYHSAAREHNKEKFHKLQQLLNYFIPVISRIDENVTRIDRYVGDIYKDIEENKRNTILQWFSTIPYQSHHDSACEGRVEHTGTWLFKRVEFVSWENSKTPSILWLHGIPGAGKTKLVSATIEYLNSTNTVQFDRVAFFYCKRDEEDRRDREKVLLSLIKQLACPPIDKTRRRTRICAEALQAYDTEQNDPSSRRQLNFDSCLKLLGQLVECFRHPVVVLDALDECTEEVRSQLLRGLLSVIRKAKRPFKVFISSRHSLDIETRLQDLPHVCIEARDNTEDIANHVQQELTLAIQDKMLLQGNVSQELRKCVEEVILRDANGMFLWVDWQLRELCKLMRESDIRARLGMLPKGLTGVYHEIVSSIKSQPDCNVDLAIRALQWMLVSERSLKPGELVVAAQLNPSMQVSVAGSAPTLDPTLTAELLIHSCKGLLLLDTKLDVVRFSHLSVREYLEAQNETWVIDAQFLVSESCLWTLQCGDSLNSPLYDYAARNWFKHCRSYQDLVLSRVSIKDTKHELSILLLNSFLGSFEHPSASYVKWVDWLNDSKTCESEINYLARLTPAFSAAFAGLGELVSWLWHAEGHDMKIKQNDAYLLLELLKVACHHGTAWIVFEMLGWGFETHHVQDALCFASEAGNLSIVNLLLDQGADVNYHRDNHSTALAVAAHAGNLETVTFLLDRGADVNLISHEYGTALGAAAFRNPWIFLTLSARSNYLTGGGDFPPTYDDNQEIITLLLDRGADINVPGGEYGSALGCAALTGNLEIAALLLDRGADVNVTGSKYGTALGCAVSEGNFEIVILLLDRGAEVNLPCGEHGSALGTASYQDNLEIVAILLGGGADANATHDEYGTTLGAAAFNGNLAIVTLLLDQGADANATGSAFGTALGAAVFNGNLEVVTLLLDQGADVNVTGGVCGTALGAAIFNGNMEIITLFLNRGADINLTDGVCGTALGTATLNGNLELVTFLLDRGADVNLTGGSFGTALGAVAGGPQAPLEIATLLHPRSNELANHIHNSLHSPEYAALVICQLKIVLLLLGRGADINITFSGKYGTALGAAAYGGEVEMVKLLLSQGANPDLTNSEGARPRDLAEQQGRLDIVEVFGSRCVEGEPTEQN